MNGPPVTTSVVIPALNAEAVIADQLVALAAQDHRGAWEVIVADNGSSDGTRAVVESWAPRLPGLRVVDASGVQTVSHARNVGVRASSGDLILLCDADDVVTPGWLSAMVGASTHFDAIGGRLDLSSLNSPIVRDERPAMFQDGLEVIGDFLPYAVGANCAFTRRAFDEVGGFDTRYVRGGDDVDFFWKIQLAGFRLGFASDAVVAYRYRPGLRARARQFFRYGRSDPQLYRAYRHAGMPRSSTLGGLARGAHLIARAPLQILPPTRSPDWVWKASMRAGRLAGSVKYRVLYL